MISKLEKLFSICLYDLKYILLIIFRDIFKIWGNNWEEKGKIELNFTDGKRYKAIIFYENPEGVRKVTGNIRFWQIFIVGLNFWKCYEMNKCSLDELTDFLTRKEVH